MTTFTANLRSKRLLPFVAMGVWIVVAFALPLRYVGQARRHARLQLAHALSNGQPDDTGIMAVFDTATDDVIAAAAVPFLVFGLTVLLLVRQLRNFESRYNALIADFCAGRAAPAEANDYVARDERLIDSYAAVARHPSRGGL